MPHATEPLTNGDKSSSQFLSHLTSYPVVNDSIEGFKSHRYGRKSIDFADGVYTRFGKPVQPYLETPYSYAKPYVQKADELADSGLGRVESHFPIVKEDTNTVVDTAKGYVWWPYNYVITTWNDEYTKTARHNERGPGMTTNVMAVISTELKIASDFFQAVADFLGPKYDESKKKSAEYVRRVEDQAGQYKQAGIDKASEVTQLAHDKLDEYSKQGQQKAKEAQKVAEQKTNEAQKKVQQK